MKLQYCDDLTATLETEGRSQLTRHEVLEMHQFDEDAAEEQALCGKDTAPTERRGVRGYLEDRLHERWVGTVCEECKALAAPFAVKMSCYLQAEGLVDEAEDYRLLASTLAKETGQHESRG